MTGIIAFLAGSRFGRIVAAVVAAVLLVLGLRKMWKAEGARGARRDVEREALEDAFDNIEDARRARRDALAIPDDRLRDNDGHRRD